MASILQGQSCGERLLTEKGSENEKTNKTRIFEDGRFGSGLGSSAIAAAELREYRANNREGRKTA